MSLLISDHFTASQVSHLREMFTWFSEISKCYSDFHPCFSVLFSGPAEQLRKVLNRKFSSVMTELAQTVGTEPSEFAFLNLLPISFPRQVIAYSLLLCQLIDIHQRLVSTEIAERSRRELFDIRRRFPSSRVILGWRSFADRLHLQNELIRLVAGMRTTSTRNCERMVRESEELAAVGHDIVRVWQVDFVNLRDQRLLALEELVDASVFLRTLEQIEKARLTEFKEIMLAQNIEITGLLELRERLVDENADLRDYLDRPKSAARRSYLPTLNEKMKETNKLVQMIETSFQNLEGIATGLRAMKSFADHFCDRKAVYFQTVVVPSRMNLDATIKGLQAMVADKKKDAIRLLKEICDGRLRTG